MVSGFLFFVGRHQALGTRHPALLIRLRDRCGQIILIRGAGCRVPSGIPGTRRTWWDRLAEFEFGYSQRPERTMRRWIFATILLLLTATFPYTLAQEPQREEVKKPEKEEQE